MTNLLSADGWCKGKGVRSVCHTVVHQSAIRPRLASAHAKAGDGAQRHYAMRLISRTSMGTFGNIE
jgi:hypothetical protein